jgi:hypothetical protein
MVVFGVSDIRALARCHLARISPSCPSSIKAPGQRALSPHMAAQLQAHPLFRVRTELLARDAAIALSYKRARLIFRSYGRSR